MILMPGCCLAHVLFECECKRLVISVDSEVATFQEVSEIFNAQIHSQQFAVVCGVFSFAILQLS